MNFVRCENCLGQVPAASTVLHDAFCRRSIFRCGECGDVMPIEEREEHGARAHGPVECEACGVTLQRLNLAQHRATSCLMRLCECPWCTLELGAAEIEEHVDSCGSRTEECVVCSQRVLVRDYEGHVASGCQFPPPAAARPRVDADDTGMLACPFCHAPCGDFELLQVHVLCECPNREGVGQDDYTDESIPCEGCGECFAPGDIEAHQSVCVAVPCGACGVDVALGDLPSHQCCGCERLERAQSDVTVRPRPRVALDRAVTMGTVGGGDVRHVQHVARFFSAASTQRMVSRLMASLRGLGLGVVASVPGGGLITLRADGNGIDFTAAVRRITADRTLVEFTRRSGTEARFRAMFAAVLGDLSNDLS